MRQLLAIGLVTIFSFAEAYAQTFEGLKFQVGGFLDFTTSARIYPAARDDDPSISSSYNSFGGFLSVGGDLRVVLSRTNAVGVTIQSVNLNQNIYTIYGYNSAGNYVGAPVQDGFSLQLLELNGYFSIPIVGESWDIYLGGGPALYLGKRNLQIGNTVANTPLVTAFGIQVSAGVVYRIAACLGVRGEMKFRSPEFNSTSSFNTATTSYQGLEITLPGTQYGKINIDGTDFTLGIFYEL
ncbi:MAG: hypothetical protein WAO19_04220 [Candidatus Kryptoniota bacterium]